MKSLAFFNMFAFNFYKKLSLGSKIYISTCVGLILGISFGDGCVVLEPVNTLFIRIYQIPIIPYMIFSILHSIGSLSMDNAKLMGKKGGIILLFLWAVSVFYALGLQHSFPDIERNRFFCPEPLNPAGIDFIDLFIPYNPFHSMAHGYIPAIVIFCVLIGLALIQEEHKMTLIKYAGVLASIMKSVNDYLMHLLPFGVLVISTYTFGTLSVIKLKVVLIYALASIFYLIFISMIIYPGILASISKISYRKFLHYSMPAAFIAFTTGNVFLALPVIYNLMYKFNDEENDGSLSVNGENEKGRNIISIIVPLAWLVPASYKFLVIFFVVFAHWYYDRAFNFGEQLIYYIGMIPCLFGGNSVIVPFLLQMAGLPSKAYDIFMVVANFLVYFNNANGAIFIIVCTIMCYSLLLGKIKIYWAKLILIFIVSTFSFVITVAGISLLMSKFLSGDDEVKEELTHMNIHPYRGSWYSQIKGVYLNLDEYHPLSTLSSEESLLDKIIRTKTLQVGYNPEAIPFSFFNNYGVLVGYDIDFIYAIAQELGCIRIEFYSIPYIVDYQKCLDKGIQIAIYVGGHLYRPPFDGVIASHPYMKATPVAVIPKKYKKQYPDFNHLRAAKDLRVGIIYAGSFMDEHIKRYHFVPLKHINDFYIDKKSDILCYFGEMVSAINILYPGYLIYYFPQEGFNFFFAYLMPCSDNVETFRDYINTWITIWDKYEIQKKRYEYWIMGEIDVMIGQS